MTARKKQRLTTEIDGNFAVVSLVDMEIWDAADLALIRDSLTTLIETDGYRAIGVNLSSVKYIPSGFFGSLFDWYDKGVQIRLYNPQGKVKVFLWFRMYFHLLEGETFFLSDEIAKNNSPKEQVNYCKSFNKEEDDKEDPDGVYSNRGFPLPPNSPGQKRRVRRRKKPKSNFR